MADELHRFLFEDRAIRGEIVTLEDTFQSTLRSANYPTCVTHLLGELLAVTSLLTAILKFKGEIALQIQSEGPIKYMIVNGTHDQKMRGVARVDDAIKDFPTDFCDFFSKGILTITVTPKEGQRYQGMVAVDKPSLAECIEDYFFQSEQLLTKVILASNVGEHSKASGMLLQIIPTSSESSGNEVNTDFEHVTHLANTVSVEEITSIPHEELIHRLYHDEDIRLFEPQTVQFTCGCSRERSARALKSVAKSELLEIIAQENQISMDCQFCREIYTFDEIDVENIHKQNMGSGDSLN